MWSMPVTLGGDRVGFASVGFRMEQPVVDPVVVPFLFDLLRRIFISDLHKGVNVLLRYLACKVINILSKIK